MNEHPLACKCGYGSEVLADACLPADGRHRDNMWAGGMIGRQAREDSLGVECSPPGQGKLNTLPACRGEFSRRSVQALVVAARDPDPAAGITEASCETDHAQTVGLGGSTGEDEPVAVMVAAARHRLGNRENPLLGNRENPLACIL